MKLIIEREATFEKNSDMKVKVTQKQLSRVKLGLCDANIFT